MKHKMLDIDLNLSYTQGNGSIFVPKMKHIAIQSQLELGFIFFDNLSWIQCCEMHVTL